MEEDKHGANQAEPRADAPSAGVDHAAANANATEAHGDDALVKLSAEVEAVKAENAELRDKSLRLIAEMENLRRRTERDKAEFAKYAISEFARDVIGVGDNIRRAIEAVPKDAVASDPALKSLIEGVEVTERELLKILEKYQVKRFDPLGEPFNPHLHEAMTKIDAPNVPAETVVQVIHAGYMIDERVLRPAAVIVAKGEKKPEPPKAEASEKDEAPPPGAMRVPDEVQSSADAPPKSSSRPEIQQNVLGRDFQAEKRRGNSASGEDRVAPFRRPRSAAGDQSFSELRSNGGGAPRSSALHKPVIGSGGE